jgi:hypothetical protein
VPSGSSLQRISPELALVDERLAAAARPQLAIHRDCLVGVARPLPAANDRRAQGRPLRALLRVTVVAGLCGALIAAVAVSRMTGPDPLRATTELAGEPLAGEPRAAARPADGGPASAGRSIRLRWRSAERAAFYNVILWRGSSRVRDLWPTRPAATLRSAALRPGTYRWFVYPAWNTGTGTTFGPLLARGAFAV